MEVRVLSWAPFFTLILLLPALTPFSHADYTVQRIESPRTVRVVSDTPGPCPEKLQPGERMIILSTQEGGAVGYGDIDSIEAGGVNCEAILRVRIHEQDALVMEGDRAIHEDFRDKISLLPGRVSLQMRGKRANSARYKPLAYFGPFLGDGGVLDEGEFLVDPIASLQYGISNAFTVETITGAAVLGAPNLGFKYDTLTLWFFQLTTGALLAHDIPRDDSYLRLQALVTIPSNARFISYTQFMYFFRPQNGLRNSFTDPQLSVVNEFLMASWNRILFGPLYNFELNSVGAFVNYLMIWNKLHIALGVQSQDLTNLRIDQNVAYTPTFGLWWRL